MKFVDFALKLPFLLSGKFKKFQHSHIYIKMKYSDKVSFIAKLISKI